MSTKICTGCHLEKDISQFSWSIQWIKRYPRCKVCRSEERSERYEKNKEAELAYKWDRQLRKREQARIFVFGYLKEQPCIDCDQDDPLVLTFDHVRGTKKMNIS